MQFSFDSVFFCTATAIHSLEKQEARVTIMEHVIGGKFKLGRKIGSGSFGELYLGMLHVPCAQNCCHLVNQVLVIYAFLCAIS